MKILSKQFYALLYDILILIAVSMLATAMFQAFSYALFYENEAFDESFLKAGLGHLKVWLQMTLVAIYFAYYHFSFVHGGQTIGMKSWKIQLKSRNARLTVTQTLTRFILAWPSFLLFGLGYLYALKDAHCHSIPDKFSGTEIVYKT